MKKQSPPALFLLLVLMGFGPALAAQDELISISGTVTAYCIILR